MIEVTNLSKTYLLRNKEPGFIGAIKSLLHYEKIRNMAVRNVSFNIQRGQSVACIGENGAGKSTLIKMMIGILTPSEGEVTIDGISIRKKGNDYLKQIGVIFGQKSNLWTDIPVIESYNAIQTLYKVDKTLFKENFEMITELLGLSSILSSPARKLSLGQRMKADIGMIFLHRPSILFLDEPTIGLDINVKHTIRKFLKRMNQEQGVSIFLTSHDLDDIDEICNDTILLSQGEKIYDGSLKKLKHSYVNEKVVKITGFQKENILSFLPKIHLHSEGQIATLQYKREHYTSDQILNAISHCYQVEDIVIQEPDIDYIVSSIFSNTSKANLVN